MKRFLFFALVALVAAVATYKYFYPTYGYRYRLIINVEADGKLHSASSIVEVRWSAFFLPDYHFNPELGGQAALVDLGERGAVVATLINGEDYGPARDGAWGAIWIVPRAFGIQTGSDQIARRRKGAR